MTSEHHPAYDLYCSMLDAWGKSVALGLATMRTGFVMHGHRDAFEPGWTGRNGTEGPSDITAADERADARTQRLLAKLNPGLAASIGAMPGFEDEPEQARAS